MDMPPIHMCAFLSHENERLKTKIADLKRHIAHLERTVAEKNFNHARSCEISCQTDIGTQHRLIPPPPPPPLVRHSSDEQIRLHRLLNAQNELLKKYENESKHDQEQNRLSSSSSSPSSGLVNNYERRLIQCEKEKEQTEQRAVVAQKRMAKFEERYERMKKEMSVLDGNFFEEIEDIKFALQQATNLNREYEKTVQMLSTRLGISYPKMNEKRN